MERCYVRIGERQVHLRCAGEGPPVVLLHQSPTSSRELVPLIELLSPHFRVFAPDTPGFGQSDPLAPSDSEPGIDAFVDALARLFDALGLQSAALYGTHTGAIQAVRFAVRFPERVRCLVANGVLVNSGEERADLVARYFPRFEPHWDGSHLAWLWSRLRDQYTFFPWYARDSSSRFSWPASVADMDVAALEFLQAGDNYRGAYRAVVDYAIADDLARLQRPSYLVVAATDALSAAVPHYPPLREQVTVEVVADFDAVRDATLRYLLAHGRGEHAAAVPAAPPLVPGVECRFLRLAAGNAHLRVAGEQGADAPILCLHAPGSSSRGFTEAMAALAPERQLLAPDLPGHGETEVAEPVTVDATAQFLESVLDGLGLDSAEVVTSGAAWVYAAALRRRQPGRIAGLCFLNPEFAAGRGERLREQPLPCLDADDAGSHLQRAWFYLRDRHLFFPWFCRDADSLIHGLARVSPQSLHLELLDLLKSRDGLRERLQAAWSVPFDAAQSSGAALLACDWHPSRQLPADWHDVPDEAYRWAGPIGAALARSRSR